MMTVFLNVLSALFIAGGLLFYLIGVVGLFRMPDVFTRMHATTKCDTLGAAMLFIGLVIWQGFTLVSLELIIILALIWLTTPTAAHYIANAEHSRRKQGEEAPK